MPPKTGHQMFAYRNTATVAVPTWSELAAIGDLNIPQLSRGMAELKRRGNDFTKNLASIIQSIRVEFTIFHGMEATEFNALRAAFFAGTVYEYAIMNGAIATSTNEGLRLPALIADFPWSQGLEDVSSHEMALVCGYMEEASAEVDPQWYTVP